MAYQAFDLTEAGPERLGEILAQVIGLLAAGELAPLPVRAWDVRRAPEAFRFMSQARHTGKIVLTIPPAGCAATGTVLVTGGTGALGGLVARHLAGTGRAAALVLASRAARPRPGAAALAADLAAAGRRGAGRPRVTRPTGRRWPGCWPAVPADRPLTGVVHAAGVLDDGVIGSLTPERVDAVLRPKADAAWHLHELTARAGPGRVRAVLLGGGHLRQRRAGQLRGGQRVPGRAGQPRQARGLPAVSLAWGLWAEASGMTGAPGRGRPGPDGRGGDGRADRRRGPGAARPGAGPGRGGCWSRPGWTWPRCGPGRAADAARRCGAAWSGAPARPPRRPRPAAWRRRGPLRQQLAGLPAAERDRVLLDLVRAHAAAVLGHASPERSSPAGPSRDLGFDSLTAVELRNRLNAATGLRLPATLVFDYPAPARSPDTCGPSFPRRTATMAAF